MIVRNELNFWQLGVTFAGCFLGVGYVSGQELWQFFGVFGAKWRVGLGIALGIVGVFGYLLLWIMRASAVSRAEDIVFTKRHKWLKRVLKIVMGIFLYTVVIIMAAGVGALAEQLWGISAKIVAVGFCLMCALVSIGGVRSMVGIFSAIVPLLAIAAVIIGSRVSDMPIVASEIEQYNSPLLANWYMGAVLFAAHNIFGSLGVLAPLGCRLSKQRNLGLSVGVGVGILGVVAFFILNSLERLSIAAEKVLPMLYIAAYINEWWGVGYAVLLFLAMSAAAVAPMVALKEILAEKWRGNEYGTVTFLAAICAGGSLGGFTQLISLIYPLYGYVGVVILLGIGEHFWVLWRRGRKMSR